MSDDGNVQRLKEQVERLSQEVARSQAPRLRGARVVAAAAVVAALFGFVASAQQTFTCGALPLGLNCFLPNTPATASLVNGNFNVLGTKAQALEARIAALETRVAALEGLEKTVSGNFFAPNGSCTSANAPCVVTFPPNSFTRPPRCTITAEVVDPTGYREHLVIQSILATEMRVWVGNYYTSGTTVAFFWVCSGT